jgi:magnesium and cobalt transporter
VSDPHPARLNERDDKREVKRVDKREERREDKRSFLQKLAEFLHPGPDSKDELIETLAEAEDNEIINAQSRFMLEGVIRMADMSAGDAMVAARAWICCPSMPL